LIELNFKWPEFEESAENISGIVPEKLSKVKPMVVIFTIFVMGRAKIGNFFVLVGQELLQFYFLDSIGKVFDGGLDDIL
jgi:hypothetical protein